MPHSISSGALESPGLLLSYPTIALLLHNNIILIINIPLNLLPLKPTDQHRYAHYLRTNPKIQRPYRQELLEQDQRHGNDVIKGLTNSNNSENKPITYVKHIAKFWDPSTLNMDLLFGEEDEHMLLVRDPVSVVQSWGRASRDSDGFTDTCT